VDADKHIPIGKATFTLADITAVQHNANTASLQKLASAVNTHRTCHRSADPAA